jgi:hypothetical protein
MSGHSLRTGNSIFYYFFSIKEKVYPVMDIVTLLLSLLSIAAVFFINDRWRKITLLSLTILFLPVLSGGYCLGYILLSVILFFSTIDKRSSILNITIFIIYILVFYPIQYVFVPFKSIQAMFGKNMAIWNLLVTNTGLTFLWVLLLIVSLKEIIGMALKFPVKLK